MSDQNILGILKDLVLDDTLVDGLYYKADDPDAVVTSLPPPPPSEPQVTDLLTELVPPGKLVIASVNLPDGYVAVSQVTLTGDAVDRFVVHDTRQVGWRFSVLAENIGNEDTRFTGVFTYDVVKP